MMRDHRFHPGLILDEILTAKQKQRGDENHGAAHKNDYIYCFVYVHAQHEGQHNNGHRGAHIERHVSPALAIIQVFPSIRICVHQTKHHDRRRGNHAEKAPIRRAVPPSTHRLV